MGEKKTNRDIGVKQNYRIEIITILKVNNNRKTFHRISYFAL